MTKKVQSERIEIIESFIQETRDMIEQLEPTIVELGQNRGHANCWEILDCNYIECVRHKKELGFPCWLHTGNIKNGTGACTSSISAQDCINCTVFEKINGNPQTINAIFRLFHSMKGSASFLELENITNVAHTAESLLDLIRYGSVRFNMQHIDLLCKSCDITKEALYYLEEHFDDIGVADNVKDVVSELQKAIKDSTTEIETLRKDASESEEKAIGEDIKKEESEDTFTITPKMQKRFIEESDELIQGFEHDLLTWLNSIDDMETVDNLFRYIHSFKGNCGLFGYVELERITHSIETVLDAIRSEAKIDKPKAARVILELVDLLRDAVNDISKKGNGNIPNLELYLEILQSLLPKDLQETDTDSKRLGDILVEQGVTTPEEVSLALKEQRRAIGEILVDKGSVKKEQIEDALKHQEVSRENRELKSDKKVIDTFKRRKVSQQDIRVDLSKLDNLINLIGELAIAENEVINNSDINGLELENFNKAAEQMRNITRELQEISLTIRMIPLSGLFRRMIRLVHDLSTKSGKKVKLQLHGEETELDKTISEILTDPLVHLIRNSLDHGIELPEERLKKGKLETGIVNLSARHEEGEVWIVIEDDGRGLDKEKIIKKAMKMGLVNGDGSKLKDKEVFNLIFQPGFSTAEKVTDISGRGVGMDVVNQNLQKIRGRVEIHSENNVGTKITLRIPLTLAIIEGMILRVGTSKCILPILSVKETFRPKEQAITVTPEGQEIVRIREKFYPILRFHEILKTEPDNREFHEGILILMEARKKRICLFVDEIIGQQQTVVKGLSRYLGNLQGFSGCTILRDGEVSLIIEAGSLVGLV